MKTLLWIGAGGFIGSVFRYLLTQLIQSKAQLGFPYGTLTVNLLGCFMIGVVMVMSQRHLFNPSMVLFLAAGVCGGFTTFSAFSNESLTLLRDGQIWTAVGYILCSIILGLSATALGYMLFKGV